MKDWIFGRNDAAALRRLQGSSVKALIVGAIVGACLIASGGAAEAKNRFSGTEAEWIVIKYTLPSFPHEARRHSKGYSGVRYSLCTKDGSAKGGTFGDLVRAYQDSTGRDHEVDYLSDCGGKVQFMSSGPFDKKMRYRILAGNDHIREGDEYFRVYLTEPEVKRPGQSGWSRHSGSHHVPAIIGFKLIIKDND